MSDPRTERFGVRVQAVAANFVYPPTPNVAATLRTRRSAPIKSLRLRRFTFAALGLTLASIALLAVPQVRATLIDFLQIGAVRIFFTEPTLVPTPTGTPILVPTPILLPSLLDLNGRTTLADARAQTGFVLPLPTHPTDLAEPDYVFLQDLDGFMVVLVWLDPAQPDRVRLSLHYIDPDSFALKKVQPEVIQFTIVDGHDAIWAAGPYLLQISASQYDIRRLIEGHVLIWSDGKLTYRLETDLSMEEAVQIAESLK